MASRFATPNTFGPVLDFMCKQGDPIFQKSSLMGSVETSVFQLQLNLPYSPYLRHMSESSAFYWLQDYHPEVIEPACALFERYIKKHVGGKAYKAAQECLAAQKQNKRISDEISNAFVSGYQAALEHYHQPINTARVKRIATVHADGYMAAAQLFDKPLKLDRIYHVANDFACGYKTALEDISKPIDAAKAYRIGYAYNLGSIVALGYYAAGEYLAHGLALDDEWRTAKPHGPDSKGQPYRLNHEGGIITGGMGGKFNGLTENEVFGKKGRGKVQTNAKTQPQKPTANAIPRSMLMGAATPQKAKPKRAAVNTKTQPQVQPKRAVANIKTQPQISAVSRPTQLKSSSLTHSDQDLLQNCVLPFEGQICDFVDQKTLAQLKAQYRSGVNAKNIEGICTRREIRALLQLGPRQYANSDLKDYPRLDFAEFNIQGNSNKLQSAFNLLQANAMAGNALRKLADAKLLELSAQTRDHIDQLNHQVAEVERMYGVNLRDQTAFALSKEGVSLKEALTAITGQVPSNQALHKKGAELVCNNMEASYRQGTQIQYPWLKFYLTKPDFHCSSSFVATYLDARKLAALLSENKDALVEHWSAYDYETHQAMIAKLTYQAEKAIEFVHGCTVDQALDREFSYYDIAHVATQQGSSYQPDDLNNAPVVVPLNFREADSNNPNRHYGKVVYVRRVDEQGKIHLDEIHPFNDNCSFSVVAYELRRRGVVVEAKGFFDPNNLIQQNISWYKASPETRIALHSQSIWLNTVTGAYPDTIYLITLQRSLGQSSDHEFPQKLEQLLNQLIKPGQRFHLAWRWLSKGGHVVTLEKARNGDLFLYDPQSAQVSLVSTYFNSRQDKPKSKINVDTIITYRVDDCNIINGLAKFAVGKFGSIDVKSGRIITHDRSLQVADDSIIKFDDDIPDYVRSISCGYDIEYCGEYNTRGKLWDVYSVTHPVVRLYEKEGLCPLLGYPQYLLLAKDGSDLVMHISDEDLEITDGVEKQLEQLRKEGHKRRPEQLWV